MAKSISVLMREQGTPLNEMEIVKSIEFMDTDADCTGIWFKTYQVSQVQMMVLNKWLNNRLQPWLECSESGFQDFNRIYYSQGMGSFTLMISMTFPDDEFTKEMVNMKRYGEDILLAFNIEDLEKGNKVEDKKK